MGLAIGLHILAAVIWVGGMFFAYLALRPAMAETLEPAQALAVWRAVLGRFLRWVWLAVLLLPITGYWLIFFEYGGWRYIGHHIHIMQSLGWIMIGGFLYVWFGPYRRLRDAVSAQDWANAAKAQGKIRRLVGVNLTLGLIVIAVAVVGRVGL